MVTAVAIICVLSVVVVSLGILGAARVAAQNAADAAALAAAPATYPPAAVDPVGRARVAASGNGADLVSCRCRVDTSFSARATTVVTAVRTDLPLFGQVTVKASSRAEFDPALWLGG